MFDEKVGWSLFLKDGFCLGWCENGEGTVLSNGLKNWDGDKIEEIVVVRLRTLL